MRRQRSRLWEQAHEDLDTADKLLGVGKYFASVFLSEQAAEKAVEAIHPQKKRRVTFTHDLVELAKELQSLEPIFRAAAEMRPDYTMPRYPDAANLLPAKLYDSGSAEMHLSLTREVIRWVKDELRLEMQNS